MVLAVDIGNSNICIGGLDGADHRTIAFTTRMVTRPRCTEDEYAAEMKFLLRRLPVDPTACEGVIVCSVVPRLTGVLAAACKRLTGREALVVNYTLDTGLTFAVDEPAKVGRDRIADAAAAAEHYPMPCMTVDLGTATTYNVISDKKCVSGWLHRARRADEPAGHQRGHGAAAAHRARAAGASDWREYRRRAEQRGHVRHRRHAGRVSGPRRGQAGPGADRGRHRRVSAVHYALLQAEDHL